MKRYPWLWIGIGALVSLIPGLWMPLFDWDEGAFSEASREMITTGDLITTYLNGALRFAKPILIYWLQALSMTLFGTHALAARLPSVVCGIAWAVLVFLFGRRIHGPRAGLLSAFALLTALQTSVVIRAAISDSLLNLWIAGSMFSLFLFYKENDRKWVYWSFFAAGLGTLTKGPIAVLIPGVVSLILFGLRGDWKRWFSAMFSPIGIAIYLMIVVPWFLLEYQAQGWAFIEGFFLKHNVGRFQSSMEGHSGPIFYYIPVVILGLLPFTLALIRSATKAYKKQSVNQSWLSGLKDEHLFYLIWFGFIFLFFSVAATKLPHYVVYGYSPLFLLVGSYLDEKGDESGIKAWLSHIWLPLGLLVLFFFLPDILTMDGVLENAKSTDGYAYSLLKGIPDTFGIWHRVFLALGIAGILAIAFWSRIQLALRATLTALVFILSINLGFIPSVSDLLQTPVKEAAILARQKGWEVTMVRFYWPSFVFYYQNLVPQRLPRPNEVVLLKEHEMAQFWDHEVLYQKRGVALIRVGKISEDEYLRLMFSQKQ